ncbi:MAG: DUF4258 domain-containing protein [Chloroflexi bacterium]|nr:DUF4258 domain-containing protein [Chloroflexota bacterium]MCI0779593.1 DUF4258 domain-containing protein [Chloroflexota bacterium]MCI0888626.1 DUF4258 domain-containing protein [Chloroflexota bacterium]
MEFVFTAHARQRGRLRGVTLQMIRSAIEQPSRTGSGYGGRRVAYGEYEGRGVLKVVYAEEGETAIVITVIWE